MTEHRGYYCSRCKVRYVYHACKEKLPCEHDKKDSFYTYRWDYSQGYKRFTVVNQRFGILFQVRYVTREELDEAVEKYIEWLTFLEEHGGWATIIDVIPSFEEAVHCSGGSGATFPPKQRMNELMVKWSKERKT